MDNPIFWPTLLKGILVGVGLGFGLAWVYFHKVRLIRSRDEWYADPVIQKKYPRDFARYIHRRAMDGIERAVEDLNRRARRGDQ